MPPRSSPFRYNNLKGVQRSLAKDATEFGLRKFCPRMMKYMTVRVIGSNEYLNRHDLYAECEYVDDYPYDRQFKIYISVALDPYNFLETMMHELVHVKQFAKGEMKDYARDSKHIRWHKEKINLESVEYRNLPWEIEAHTLEKPLAHEFLDFHPEWRQLIVKS